MSERLRQREITKRATKFVAPAVAVLALASCSHKPWDVQQQAEARNDEASKSVESGVVPSLVMPGVLITDGEVNLRTSPAKVNTNNRIMIDGNNAGELLREAVGIQRPIIIENSFQIDETNDPKNWAMSYSASSDKFNNDGWRGFGLNAETAPHLRYFVKVDQPRASLCGDELVGLTPAIIHNDAPSDLSRNGATIDAAPNNPASNYQVPVGQLTWGSGPVRELIQKVEAQGYVEVPLCVPEMHEPQG